MKNMSETNTAQSTDAANSKTFCVEGMHCAGCVAAVEGALKKIENVQDVRVNLADGSAWVQGSSLKAETLLAAIMSKGFSASERAEHTTVAEQRTAIEDRQHKAETLWRRRLIVGATCWIPLVLLHWGSSWFGWEGTHDPTGPWLWVMASLALVVLVYVGSGFYASAINAAKHRTTNMDSLIAIGATAAYGLSLYVLALKTSFAFGWSDAAPEFPLYFGEAAGLLTLITLGHWLEAKTTAAASSAVRELLALQPDEITRLQSADDESEGNRIPSADVLPGDYCVIKAGERIAVDGIIISGQSAIDESVVTGEPLPIDRGPDDPVVSGSMNLNGRIVIQSSCNGRDTTVARIAEMVRTAQSSKANIQRLADKICAIFVPAVITIALIAFVGWAIFGGETRWISAIINATTVLVISCPCALGLATPTAVMVGSGGASRRGILVKSAQAIERMANVDCIMLDKTGTLTKGQPMVAADVSDAALRIAATLAKSSTHPLSVAICEEAERRGIDFTPARGTKETAGHGIEGVVDGMRTQLISRRAAEKMIGEEKLNSMLHALANTDNTENKEGGTSSIIIAGDEVRGEIEFTDILRPDAGDLIRDLDELGLRCQVLTGDRVAAAHAVAESIGLPNDAVMADLSPQDKLNQVQKETDAGYCVAMIGDGINDAAALAQAGSTGGIGIAIGTGTNIAIESADVVVPGESLSAIVDLVRISKMTFATIKQNLTLSFIYNVIAIPAAAFGLLGMQGPLIAAAAMGVSDFCVVGNSLRLRIRLARLSK